MKQWGSAIFPLSILFVLSLLTFWLRYASELDQPKHDGKHRHDPDYIVGDAKLRKIDVTGALKYTLTAKDIRHYPDDDSTDLIQPSILSLTPSKPPVTISSSTQARSPRSHSMRVIRSIAWWIPSVIRI